MSKNCVNCAHYSPYCRAGFCCFWREYTGVCEICGNTVDSTFNCKFWEKPPLPPKLTVGQIDNAIDDVKAIMKYFAT